MFGWAVGCSDGWSCAVDLAELKRLAGWIKAQAQQELSADTSFAIQLCLEEAVANIIMHGGGAKDGPEDCDRVGAQCRNAGRQH